MMKTKHAASALALLISGALLTAQPSIAQTAFVPSQTASETSATAVIGQRVVNEQNERIGDINDLVYDAQGKVTTAVIGVGGFLDLGEKNVAVPYDALKVDRAPNGSMTIRLAATKDALQAAPDFKSIDGTKWSDKLKEWTNTAKEKATEYTNMAREKAAEYTDKAKEKAAEYSDKAKEAYGKAKEQVTGPSDAPKSQ